VTIEPLARPADPATIPAVVSALGEELARYHAANPASSTVAAFCVNSDEFPVIHKLFPLSHKQFQILTNSHKGATLVTAA
jgi:hypothetical protein